tara:strand:- start:132 stop:539 length:408 start_codon:yes stop_codon:yes gene_type:complete
MHQKKNIHLGKINLLISIIFTFSLFINNFVKADNQLLGNFVEIKILDKVNSQNYTLKIEIGKKETFKNLQIKALKCKNSKFDDNPEITAYLQVRDNNLKGNDKVFIFNDWTFASSPTIKPFDHPIYDIWLTKCYG